MTSLHDLVNLNPYVKGLRHCKGPNVMHFYLDQVQALLICRIVCFNQEQRLAGLMSEVCPFLKNIKKLGSRPSQVFLVESK